MLKQIKLTNFRRFQAFSLKLGPGNILVGPNNSGKSSILDAFRILEACLRNTKTKNPKLIEIESKGVFDGYEISESILPFSLANITHNYNNQDACLEFSHNNGNIAVILLHPERLTRFYIETRGARLTQSAKFRNAFPINIVNIPTLAPLEAEESLVEEATLQRNTTTRLASRVFRNFWRRQSDEEFQKFKNEIESAWPNISIKKPELTGDYPPKLHMYYGEGRIDREIQWSGFGFQVWMLMHTHFRRGGKDSILIIDEPDIYLHPDLQRKLLHGIREKFSQFLLATHAIEIINEADSNELISVNSNFRTGKRINSEAEFSSLYQYIGSGSNADFARIARSKKVIFVEGKDAKLLRKMASKFDLRTLADIQNIPIIQLGGFSEWKKAANAVWAFKNVLELSIDSFCLFDRDYKSQAEIDQFLNELKTEELNCRVLFRKEIENYLIEPDLIHKAIQKRQKSSDSKTSGCGLNEIETIFTDIAEEMKHHVSSQLCAGALRWAKKCGSKEDESSIIKRENKSFETKWKEIHNRIAMVPGKELLAEMNTQLIARAVGSVTPFMVIDQMQAGERYDDLRDVLSTIEEFCSK